MKVFLRFHGSVFLGKGIEDSLFSLFSMVIGVISTQTYVQALFSAKDSATAAAGLCHSCLDCYSCRVTVSDDRYVYACDASGD